MRIVVSCLFLFVVAMVAPPAVEAQTLAPPQQIQPPQQLESPQPVQPPQALETPQTLDTPLTAQPSVARGIVRGESLIVVVPGCRDALLGYSVETGRWNKQLIRVVDHSPIVPMAAGNVAAVRVGNRVYAFSGLKGEWDSVTVSPHSTAMPELERDAAMFVDGNNFYVFSAKSGKWRGVQLDSGKLMD